MTKIWMVVYFLAIVVFFGTSVYVINRALTPPPADFEIQPVPTGHVEWNPLLLATTIQPEDTRPYFIPAIMLHQACKDKQPQCVIYMYGVIDTIIDSMGCEMSKQASKETAQATLTSLGRLHSPMSGHELANIGAAQTVTMAFITTSAYEVCAAAAKAPKASL